MSSDQIKNKKYIQKRLFQIRVVRVNLRLNTSYRAAIRARSALVQSQRIFTSSAESFEPGCSGV